LALLIKRIETKYKRAEKHHLNFAFIPKAAHNGALVYYENGRSSDLLLGVKSFPHHSFRVPQWAGVVVLFNVLKLTAAGTVQEFFPFFRKGT
jgi:hypothetical protein